MPNQPTRLGSAAITTPPPSPTSPGRTTAPASAGPGAERVRDEFARASRRTPLPNEATPLVGGARPPAPNAPGVSPGTRPPAAGTQPPSQTPPTRTPTTPAAPAPSNNPRTQHIRLLATQVHEAMFGGPLLGLGTDEAALYRALRGMSKDDLAALNTAYHEQYHTPLDRDVASESSGQELKGLRSLLAADRLNADVALLSAAIEYPGTNEALILAILEDRTPPELQRLKAKYQLVCGEALVDAIRGDLSGATESRILALLNPSH